MKAEDLVIGNLYVDKDKPEWVCKYTGLVTYGPYKGQYDFDAATSISQGCICDDQELETDMSEFKGELS